MARRLTERQLKALRNIQLAEEGRPMFVNAADAENANVSVWLKLNQEAGAV